MKLHIENIHVTIHQPPAGLIAGMTLASVEKFAAPGSVPAIGEKWPGTEATYAGLSLSSSGDRLVHLILWDTDPKDRMEHADAVKFAEAVNPEMASHLPTRHQSIDLFERLADQFEKDPWYWTMTKTPSGQSAFLLDFGDGDQYVNDLSAECRVRAVSEIPL